MASAVERKNIGCSKRIGISAAAGKQVSFERGAYENLAIYDTGVFAVMWALAFRALVKLRVALDWVCMWFGDTE